MADPIITSQTDERLTSLENAFESVVYELREAISSLARPALGGDPIELIGSEPVKPLSERDMSLANVVDSVWLRAAEHEQVAA